MGVEQENTFAILEQGRRTIETYVKNMNGENLMIPADMADNPAFWEGMAQALDDEANFGAGDEYAAAAKIARNTGKAMKDIRLGDARADIASRLGEIQKSIFPPHRLAA